MKTLPLKLPAAYKLLPGQTTSITNADTGGYDMMIAGYGFRLASDTQFPYIRATEPTTVRRLDNSAEVGEQTLSELPWLKSQSSFHAGAGQLNLEAPYTAFQYQQEQIAHLRYDTSLGVDPWTPGQVKRLPDATFSSFGFNISCMVTATVAGVDVAVVGGTNSLYQISWSSGPDSAPTITAMDMTSATYGGMSNITVSSLTTDGRNYYALVQLASQGSTSGVLTFIVTGKMESSAAPTVLYEVPNYQSATPRTNLCTNPSFETGTAGWAGNGSATIATATSPTPPTGGRTNVLAVTFANGTAGQFNGAKYTLTTVKGNTYTFSAKVYVPTGVAPQQVLVGGIGFGGQTTLNNQWQTISMTFTATGTSEAISIYANGSQTAGQLVYIDEVLIEQTGSVGTYFDGATTSDANYTYSWAGTADGSTSSATPTTSAANAYGCVGWVKERLIGAVSSSVYELGINVPQHSQLPPAKFTHPVSAYTYSAISESPKAILVAGTTGMQSTVMAFSLDTTGATPTLGGGATIASLPTGEQVETIAAYLGSFVAIGTTKGVRVGTFDTYSGDFTYGPLSVTTTAPVYSLTGRDRFVFAGYSNQQADGSTGLVRVDLTQPIDASGRLAWAPDLRPKPSDPQTGTVYAVGILPSASRIVFATTSGFYVEGNGPGSSGTSWLRTSRIRYDTNENKLFKTGRINGTLDTSTIQVTGITEFGGSVNLGTFGFIAGTSSPGEFALPTGLQPWIQLQFTLSGANCVLNSYVSKAYPQPSRQRVITMTVNCFRNEVDRFGLDVTDPLFPRDRYNAVKALESAGGEYRLVEFTFLGPVVTMVVIDSIEFHSFSRPSIDDDFGGYITFKFRETLS